MVLLIYTTFWHAKDGLRVVVEDYVHDEGGKFFWLALLNFLFIWGGASPSSRARHRLRGSANG
jgi:succinate dehydrogenase / fumarate reductase membrane anchor subunit